MQVHCHCGKFIGPTEDRCNWCGERLILLPHAPWVRCSKKS